LKGEVKGQTCITTVSLSIKEVRWNLAAIEIAMSKDFGRVRRQNNSKARMRRSDLQAFYNRTVLG